MDAHAPFLQLIADAPTDPHVAHVYADWLEETGDKARAEFIRVEYRVRALSDADPAWAPAVARLRVLAKRLPRAWTSMFNAPSVSGYTFAGTSMNHHFVGRFLANHKLNYTQSTGSYENGTWWQTGSIVTWEMNKRYAVYTGALVGGSKLVGDAKNVARSTWTFVLEHTTVPETVALPEGTNTQIYPQPRPRKKKKKAPPKKTKVATKAGSGGARATRKRA